MGHRTRLALLSIAALALLGASRCEKKADDAELEPMLIVKGTLTGEGIECPALRDQGGILYTLGGVVYGLRRPNPFPRWFGFHEVFHTFTVLAFATHYVGVSLATYSLR